MRAGRLRTDARRTSLPFSSSTSTASRTSTTVSATPSATSSCRGIAQRLEHYLRPGDTVARIGGDEFAILLNRINDIPGAIHVAERIQELLGMTFSIDGHEVFVTASIGIAHSATGYRSPR